MRVMWICNIPIMKINRAGESKAFGGWMSAMGNLLSRQQNIKLAICYPQNRVDCIERQQYEGIRFFGFYVKDRCSYDDDVYKKLKKILKIYVPDIIHLFGTEFPHSLSAMKLDPCRTLIDIQGLVGVYAKHYATGLPATLTLSFSGLFSENSISNELRLLKKRGKYEKKVLEEAKYVTGRTDWDFACVKVINREVKYFKCNRILRDCFYGNQWVYENCKKHSIFISQADYPVKGFHIFLKALHILQKKYQDIRVVVAGSLLNLEKPVIGTYDYHIKKLMKKYHQEKIIEFVGLQDECQMREWYLRSNVFVMPSLIENSPNSLGEAMIMGVPCVAAFVGGAGSYLEHGVEGFLYQADAEYMLAYYIEKVFENPRIAEKCSLNAKKKAEWIFNKETNMHALIEIYADIVRKL